MRWWWCNGSVFGPSGVCELDAKRQQQLLCSISIRSKKDIDPPSFIIMNSFGSYSELYQFLKKTRLRGSGEEYKEVEWQNNIQIKLEKRRGEKKRKRNEVRNVSCSGKAALPAAITRININNFPLFLQRTRERLRKCVMLHVRARVFVCQQQQEFTFPYTHQDTTYQVLSRGFFYHFILFHL